MDGNQKPKSNISRHLTISKTQLKIGRLRSYRQVPERTRAINPDFYKFHCLRLVRGDVTQKPKSNISYKCQNLKNPIENLGDWDLTNKCQKKQCNGSEKLKSNIKCCCSLRCGRVAFGGWKPKIQIKQIPESRKPNWEFGRSVSYKSKTQSRRI